ncbi:glycosyltransferase family 4 protein [Pseudobacteriovorax antillogorgiicola]|uniref:Glycosyl transferases group 1 n=1 Tax=Pseudobacteriovorax antillogorgiicola TaxID=1513793 RepID=A0A1Y6C3A8_9BACT|nr:glycosyltransferase family 4 protein [Pseudobacteriovorax antillogorgiicola]TCS49816.1 glycosyl transferase family 1 [Pseudobacteriovorax antillogorgiicola]SMF43213.1 Glycosyl transferases group 1 [Pseudobacteriovorax antillogorgiicola]
MNIDILLPHFHGAMTGGNLYNRKLITYLRKTCQWDIREHSIPRGRIFKTRNFGSSAGILLVDSILNPLIDLDKDQRCRIAICHGPLGEALLGENLSHYDFSVFPGHSLVEDLRKHRGEIPKHQVIAPGIDHDLFHGVPLDRPRNLWVSVGSVLPEKGYHIVLEAMKSLPGPWSYHIIGNKNLCPTYADELKVRVEQLKLTTRIKFHGELDQQQVAQWLRRAGLYIAAAPYESHGIAIQEAMAVGLPIMNCAEGAPRSYLAEHHGWHVKASAPVVRRFLQEWLAERVYCDPSQSSWASRTWADVGSDWLNFLESLDGEG